MKTHMIPRQLKAHTEVSEQNTVNPLYTDIRYNDKIQYNDNLKWNEYLAKDKTGTYFWSYPGI